jgi:hypothetical protein
MTRFELIRRRRQMARRIRAAVTERRLAAAVAPRRASGAGVDNAGGQREGVPPARTRP